MKRKQIYPVTTTDLFTESRNRIIDYLSQRYLESYTISEISEGSGLARSAIYNNLDLLLQVGMVEEVKKIGRIRLFKYGSNEIAKSFIRFIALVQEELVTTK